MSLYPCGIILFPSLSLLPSVSLIYPLPPPPPLLPARFPDSQSCLNLHLCGCLSVCLSPSLSPENSDLNLSYFAEFVCCEVLVCSFLLKMYFSLPQLFVFLFDVLRVAVFVIRDRLVKKHDLSLSLILV